MTVYCFAIFYEDEPQHRYVVARSEEEATEKLEKHFAELEEQGYARPCFVTSPTIEISYVVA